MPKFIFILLSPGFPFLFLKGRGSIMPQDGSVGFKFQMGADVIITHAASFFPHLGFYFLLPWLDPGSLLIKVDQQRFVKENRYRYRYAAFGRGAFGFLGFFEMLTSIRKRIQICGLGLWGR